MNEYGSGRSSSNRIKLRDDSEIESVGDLGQPVKPMSFFAFAITDKNGQVRQVDERLGQYIVTQTGTEPD